MFQFILNNTYEIQILSFITYKKNFLYSYCKWKEHEKPIKKTLELENNKYEILISSSITYKLNFFTLIFETKITPKIQKKNTSKLKK